MALSKSSVSIITALIAGVTSLAGAYISASKGLLFFPNRTLSKQVDDLKKKLENRSELAGDFEWQWAGDNWLGSVKFQNLANGKITAQVDMRTFKYNAKTRAVESTPVFRSDTDGSADVVSEATIRLNLPVEMSPQYLKIHPTPPRHIVLNAELQPV